MTGWKRWVLKPVDPFFAKQGAGDLTSHPGDRYAERTQIRAGSWRNTDGGRAQVLANAPTGRGGTWSADGVILFAPTGDSPIYRVSATGGEVTVVTRLQKPQQTSHHFPRFLPDGRHFVCYVTGGPEVRGVYASQLDGSEPQRLLIADTTPVYTSSGQLLFVRDGVLFSQMFDAARLALTGTPSLVAEA